MTPGTSDRALQAVGAIGARLDRLPTSRFHWRLLALISGGMFLDGFDVYLAGGVLASLVNQGWSNLALNAQFIALTFAGMAIGAAYAGYIGDRLGRRYSYQLNLAVFGVASLAAAAAPTMHWLMVFRCVAGIGLGAEIVIGYGMLSEFVPPAARGKWAASLALVANSSLPVATLLNYLIIPHFGWRWMFVIAGAGALVMWYLRKSMPESPRWLESIGRHDEAERVMQAIETDVSQTRALSTVVLSVRSPTDNVTLLSLFKRPRLRGTVVGIVINVSIGVALYGFASWIPTLLIKQGLSVATSLGYSVFMSAGAPLGAVLAYLMSDRFGRRPAMVIASLCTIVFGGVYCAAQGALLITAAGFMVFTSIYFLMSVGLSAYVPELFETPYRLRGVGVCSTIGRIVTMISPFAIVRAFNYAGLYGVVGLLSLCLLILLVVLLTISVETSGKSLEQITAHQCLATNKVSIGESL